jgi:DNA-binding NarL/FixJ family response regulator
MGIEHQIAFTLPHEPERILAVVLARSDADFSDSERDLLEQARPFLIQAYRNAIRYSELLAAKTPRGTAETAPDLESLVALGLTHRQAQVLQLLAIDITERDIATHLQISQRTVQKHLRRAYRTLSVNDRRHATSVAWATIYTPTQTQTQRIYRPGKPGRS